jgi:hypothetical protein
MAVREFAPSAPTVVAPQPRLRSMSFSAGTRSAPPVRETGAAPRGDKSRGPMLDDQDKAVSVSSFAPRAEPGSGGVDIDLDTSLGSNTTGIGAGIGALAGLGAAGIGLGVAALLGAALTGGLLAGVLLGGAALGAAVGAGVGASTVPRYRYTQTIDTNVPKGGTTSPYVDPRPNDDSKPFYWTDSEERSNSGKFHDSPSRGTPKAGTTRWDAVVSITEVTDKKVKVLDNLKYGFSLDTAGAVTARPPAAPTSGDVGTHVSTLSSEFPDWTFTV